MHHQQYMLQKKLKFNISDKIKESDQIIEATL